MTWTTLLVLLLVSLAFCVASAEDKEYCKTKNYSTTPAEESKYKCSMDVMKAENFEPIFNECAKKNSYIIAKTQSEDKKLDCETDNEKKSNAFVECIDVEAKKTGSSLGDFFDKVVKKCGMP